MIKVNTNKTIGLVCAKKELMSVTKLPKSHAEFRIAQHLPFLLT